MSDAVFWTLGGLLPVLLVVLLVFEKRRQKQQRQFYARLEQLEQEGRDDELDAILEDEEAKDLEPASKRFAAFMKGRPTRRLTALGVYSILHGVVAIGLIGFILYMVFKSALVDPAVRLVLLVTVGVAVVIVVIAAIAKRAKQERELF